MKWILLLLVILILFIYAYASSFNSDYYRGPISDHFDGKLFYNPVPYHQKSWLDVWRWRLSRHSRPEWPAHVDNLPHSPVTTVTKPDQIKVTFVNHSTVLIQSQNFNLLTDPIWSYRASPFTSYGPARARDPGIPFASLPPIDVVVISHSHYDHLDINTLIKLNNKFHPYFLVPLGDKTLLEKSGMQNVVELDWWQEYKLKNVTITFLPAKHWSARGLSDRFRTLWGSYGMQIAGKNIYFAGDTGYSPQFIEIRKKWHTPDLAILPIGAYLPRWFMQDNHLSPADAVQVHLDLHAKQSFPIHYGTFQLGDDAFDQPTKELKLALTERAIPPNHFIILPEGQSIFLK